MLKQKTREKAVWSYQGEIFERVTRYIFHKKTISQTRKCWRSKPPFLLHHVSFTLHTRFIFHVSTNPLSLHRTRVSPMFPAFSRVLSHQVNSFSFDEIGHLHLLRDTQKELRISFRLWCLWCDDSYVIIWDCICPGFSEVFDMAVHRKFSWRKIWLQLLQ